MEDIPVLNIIGEGNHGYVYVLTYESMRSNTTTAMPLKIGCTRRDDIQGRIKQMMTGFPERPIVEMLMRVPHPQTPNALETLIHRQLKANGHQLQQGGTREWFHTSPDKLEEIYNDWFYTHFNRSPNPQEVMCCFTII